MAPGLVRLTVADVRVAVPAGAGVEAGMVVLKEDLPPERHLRIVVGQSEARAIHAAWHGNVPPRPSTWDVAVSAMALLDGRISRAVITSVEEQRHWFASIEIDRAGSVRSLSCRPSDAVALALRSYGAGIFAYEEVLATAGVLADGSRPPVTASQVDPGGREGTSFI